VTPPITRIVFTGDFMRPSPDAFRPTQHENIRWLAQLLAIPVSMAIDLPQHIVSWDDDWTNQAVFEADAISSLYGCFWLEPSIYSWSKIYNTDYLPAAVEQVLHTLFSDSLVIGFELPPFLMHFLSRHHIPFLDCALSPVRFMDDLLIGVSTSDAQAQDLLRPYEVAKELQRLTAGVLSAHVAKQFKNAPWPNTLLLIMQTGFDKAVVGQGSFVTLEHHLGALLQLSRDYAHVLIKTHPLEPTPRLLDKLLQTLPNAKSTDENFYRLISHPNVIGVAALSSSAIYEAAFFGKRAHLLMPNVDFNKSAIGHDIIDIGDAILTPDFWRDALSFWSLPVSAKDGLSLSPKPNRFRLQHRTAWGYNQVDTDIAVAWANT
jgi:hypothetical protein